MEITKNCTLLKHLKEARTREIARATAPRSFYRGEHCQELQELFHSVHFCAIFSRVIVHREK